MAALRMLLGLGLVAGIVGGCASDGHSTGDAGDTGGGACELIGGPSTDSAPIGNIDYRVTGGFSGQGDGTSLQITPDGKLTRHTLQRGTEQGQLDPLTFNDLVDKIRTAQLPTLCTKYPCSSCGDDYVDDVSVQFGGIAYATQASELATLPPPLKLVIDTLKQIVSRPLP